VAKLEERTGNALNEARTLVLGAQVLLGFNFQAVFTPAFETLPALSRNLKVCSLSLMLVAIGLLISPAAYHRIVEDGTDSDTFLRFLSIVTELALLPFALGLGIDLAVATARVFGGPAGSAIGVAGLGFALFFWWGIEALRRNRRGKGPMGRGGKETGARKVPALDERIQDVLTETRVVLPGAQALLGFQFIATLSSGFEKLAQKTQGVHLASLGAIAVATVFLMAPAAWHRIVEEGENSEAFHRVASRFLLAALAFLALGLAGDVFVVSEKVFESSSVALAAAGATLFFLCGLWFGYTLLHRARNAGRSKSARRATT